MQIRWGVNAVSGAEVVWNTANLTNAHIGVFGDSGMGKTHMLRRIVAAMEDTGHPRIRFHVFDSAGDMTMPGESAVAFHESADFGFNPLELNPDPEFGGVRKRIQSLITAMNSTSVRLGPRQERALAKLLTGLYKREGFIFDDHRTWGADVRGGKSYPSLLDAIEYGKERIKAMYTGSNQRSVRALEEVSRLAKQIRIKESVLNRLGHDEALTKLQRELDILKEKAVDAYREAVFGISTGDELEEALDSDTQKETLQSVVDRLENLYQIGIYRSTPPPLDPRCRVWRYIIKSLSADEQKLFVLTRLETIFTRAIQRGKTEQVVDVCVLDEAHRYSDPKEDYILNRMTRESRKYGVSMIFGSQAPSDFADILIANLASKVILGLDQTNTSYAIRKLGVAESALKSIIPQRRVLVQMKGIGELNHGANLVVL